VPATERIRLRVSPREGVRSTRILDAIKEYAAQETRNPWVIRSRRPLVLEHRSPRAQGVRYSFERDEDGVSLVIAGGRARLGLAYAMTMLANSRFSDAVSSVEVRLPATTPASRR
jgi:hypothetical protein